VRHLRTAAHKPQTPLQCGQTVQRRTHAASAPRVWSARSCRRVATRELGRAHVTRLRSTASSRSADRTRKPAHVLGARRGAAVRARACAAPPPPRRPPSRRAPPRCRCARAAGAERRRAGRMRAAGPAHAATREGAAAREEWRSGQGNAHAGGGGSGVDRAQREERRRSGQGCAGQGCAGAAIQGGGRVPLYKGKTYSDL